MVRAVIVWCGILGLASINGAVRQAWLVPHLGVTPGRAVSTVLLAALVALTAWLTIRWIRPRSVRDGVLIGVSWLALTLAFEFLAGRFLMGNSWAVLLEDYDVRKGRIWLLVPVVVSVAPLWAARSRGVIEPVTRRAARCVPAPSE